MPHNLSLALGAASITPMEVVAGWSVFANGGYKISPYFIDRIENRSGEVIYAATPQVAPSTINPTPATLAEQIIDSRTTYLLTSMLQDVIKGGIGRAASKMNRTDIAGKTGTTTDAKDSWFTGYNGDYVTSVWAGFDQPESLGRREWGVTVALPIWVDYMTAALKDKPSYSLPEPDGIVTRMINLEDGTAAIPGTPNTMMEFFKSENYPSESAESSEDVIQGKTSATEKTMMDLF
ncbi:hypothetical protein EKG40_08015 [Pseudomonas moorei]|nr:hypothetical protein EKG40_08015 [Pseudomonas moorei]